MAEPAPDLPLADPETEARASRLFEGWDTFTPEEWAARFAPTIGCSSFDGYRYRDAALHAWIHSLHALLRSSAALEACRRKAPAGGVAETGSPPDF